MMDRKISTPEAQGIPSWALEKLLKRLEEHRIPLHSILIARHGHLVLEAYSRPYGREILHRMFSQTKSLTSLAVGLLISDGVLSLQDKICDYFPEYLPGEVHPWMEKMTIEHMLMMETCHNRTTYDMNSTTENWVRSFFQTPPTHCPGTVFLYDTSSSHTLCALVEKLTGEKMLDFLKRRVLREIGFSEESYIMEDPFGTSMGGSGLMAKPMDMMRVGLMLMNHGRHPDDYGKKDGRQVYPQEYLEKALAFQVSTTMNSLSDKGYGYYFWQVPGDGFGMLGMGSQETRCYPKEDVVVVVTADTQGMQNGSDIIFQDIFAEVFEHLSDGPLPEDRSAYEALAERSTRQALPVLTDWSGENCQAEVDQVEYFFYPNRQGFRKMCFSVGTGSYANKWGSLIYENESGCHRLKFGFGWNLCGQFPEYDQRYMASAAWCESNTLYIRIYLVDESLAAVHIKLNFQEDGHLTVFMQKTEESKFNEFQGVLNAHSLRVE